MLSEYVTERSKDKYHFRLNASEVIATRGSSLMYVLGDVEQGKDVARIDLCLLNGNKIDVQIQGLRQGVAIIHISMYFLDGTIETFCMNHRGVNC